MNLIIAFLSFKHSDFLPEFWPFLFLFQSSIPKFSPLQAFFVMPIGGALFGLVGDWMGRKRALLVMSFPFPFSLFHFLSHACMHPLFLFWYPLSNLLTKTLNCYFSFHICLFAFPLVLLLSYRPMMFMDRSPLLSSFFFGTFKAVLLEQILSAVSSTLWRKLLHFGTAFLSFLPSFLPSFNRPKLF